MIPFSLIVGMRFRRGRRFHLWFPLFLVWLLLLPLVLVLFPVVFLVGLFVQVSAVRLYVTVWQILRSMRDTLVEVDNDELAFRLSIL